MYSIALGGCSARCAAAIGAAIGFGVAYVINADAVERAVRKVAEVASAVYNSLTFENLIEFTWKFCVVVLIAGIVVIPLIKGIYWEIMA